MALGFSNTARFDKALNRSLFTPSGENTEENLKSKPVTRSVSFDTIENAVNNENMRRSSETRLGMDSNQDSSSIIVKSINDKSELKFYGDVVEDTISINPTTNETNKIPKGTRVLCSHPITKRLIDNKNMELLYVYGIDRQTTKIEVGQICINSVNLINDTKTVYVKNFKF